MRLCLSPKTDADIIMAQQAGFNIPFLVYYACVAEEGKVPTLIIKNVKPQEMPKKTVRVSIDEDPSLITPEIAEKISGLSDRDKGKIYKALFRKHILIQKHETYKSAIDIASLINN